MKIIKYYIELFRRLVLIYEELGTEHNYYPFGNGTTRNKPLKADKKER